MTESAPDTYFVLLHNEAAAGRIVAPLNAFVRFNRKIDKQLRRLERRMLRQMPQLLNRGVFRGPRPHQPEA